MEHTQRQGVGVRPRPVRPDLRLGQVAGAGSSYWIQVSDFKTKFNPVIPSMKTNPEIPSIQQIEAAKAALQAAYDQLGKSYSWEVSSLRLNIIKPALLALGGVV